MSLKRKIYNMLPEGVRPSADVLVSIVESRNGSKRAHEIAAPLPPAGEPPSDNPLSTHFQTLKQGRGLWKWHHYFHIYHRHFSRFIGQSPRALEIGIHSGGSLEMWNSYFGPGCHITGVDIEPACKTYERGNIKVAIGDQGDRNFWRRLRAESEPFDIIIDDGSHDPFHQIVTLEETLPHLRAGGVYLCEDIHGASNRFFGYVAGFAANLNAASLKHNPGEAERSLVTPAAPFQRAIHSVHMYPFIIVIEKNPTAGPELICSRRGTQWQPHA